MYMAPNVKLCMSADDVICDLCEYAITMPNKKRLRFPNVSELLASSLLTVGRGVADVMARLYVNLCHGNICSTLCVQICSCRAE